MKREFPPKIVASQESLVCNDITVFRRFNRVMLRNRTVPTPAALPTSSNPKAAWM